MSTPNLVGFALNKKLADHLRVERYGDFTLTDAVRPALHVPIVPRQGYRQELYRDARARFEVPVLAAAVSREKLFDVFLGMLDSLGEMVDVVLETSHDSSGNQHLDLFRESVDLPVLKSHCCEFEELLVNDGCTGIAVMSTESPLEIQFDEHKLLVVYAPDLRPFTSLLEEYGVRRDDRLKLITEAEHLHSTDPHHRDAFEQFCFRLGVGHEVERVSW